MKTDDGSAVKIVVTGASGFIGSQVVPLLVGAGHAVHVLGRTAAADCAVHPIDLIADDPAQLLAAIAPDALLHLAWYAKPGAFWHAPENLDWVAASLRLVRGFAAAGGQRLVAAGTCAEYDWQSATLDELTTPRRPHTLYGTAKSALFDILTAGAPVLDLSFAWGRIFFPYGPFEQPGRLFSGIVDGIAARQPVACTAGLQRRDFMHVEDVARAFCRLLDTDVSGPVNIASGTTTAVRDFIACAADCAGGTDLIRLGERPTQPGEPPVMAANVARLRDEVGFVPEFDLQSGVADAVARRRKRLDIASLKV
jgi:nucleoside-diphosphate-sugar epimerase